MNNKLTAKLALLRNAYANHSKFFGVLMLVGLLAFEAFNYSTTEFALSNVLGKPDGAVCNVRRPVKSLWICALIRKIEAGGKYPYNQDVYELAERELGLPKTSYHATGERETLSWLVYFNQAYRTADDLRALGYQPLTQELIDEACR